MKRYTAFILALLVTCICMGISAPAAFAGLYDDLLPETPVNTPTDADDENDIDPKATYTQAMVDALVQQPEELYSVEDLYLAARLIYAEGKNQSDESFLAMACVVYNRLQDRRFPKTIEGIVFAPNQFTVTRNREKFDALEPSGRAINAILAVFLNGERPLPPEVMYFKSARLKKAWGKRVYYDTIGGNMYYS